MFGRSKNEMPSADTALPGREQGVSVPEEHFINGHPLTGPFPEGTEVAVFGMGCFWGAERRFWQLPGVYTTSAGYAGGATPTPATRRSARDGPVTPRSCRWSIGPTRCPTTTC